jgi:hypothetical protein
MMTNNEKTELAKIYAATCKAFDKSLEPDVLRMQIEDLSDLDFSKVVAALAKYRQDEKSITWPRAGKIRALVNPLMSRDSLANEAASRIREAIGLFGWPNGDQARKHIGELGWMVVERSGGWSYLCENHGVELQPLTFHAQARDLSKAILESKEVGVLDQPIQIEKSESNVLDFKNLLKEVPK